MKNPLNETLSVMGGVFLITLILNLILDIEFYNTNASITYLAFALVYFCFKKFAGKNKN
ncbi:hypothetical protein [Anaerococcus hydrogenalis]|uniref:Uncharacterized protein n=1 Tax=Anaerococcus hydrogenalis ACS-025-V-Sch4 TaxID=879306 RepID=F0GXZ3_9FIRM|nr:hypothetical protein [Anaerococcus hydrogenalis]EGC84903.1 hypothetical protein HMPREF9246_1539 [Anaerococcus hydrogenalis ACS-025-V-Sch4]